MDADMPVIATKQQWPATEASQIAQEIWRRMLPGCTKCVVAGSLRRKKPVVGDVEIVYVPKLQTRPDPEDLFGKGQIFSLADEVIAQLEKEGILERRLNANGQETFGRKNKLMRHVATGIPVDLFATSERNWWNYLVCRTGPAESNMEIAKRAKAAGWKWMSYGGGFCRRGDPKGIVRVRSEAEVFEFVGMEARHPGER